jgi:hypothetical protein
MDNDQIQNQDNLNLHVGFMIHQDARVTGPVLESFTIQYELQQPNFKFAGLLRLWGTYFSLVGNPQYQISILLNWATFFTMKLLSKENFQWAKYFLNSPAWQFLLHEENNSDGLQFSIPLQCPKAKAIYCSSNMQVSNLQVGQDHLSNCQTPKQLIYRLK